MYEEVVKRWYGVEVLGWFGLDDAWFYFTGCDVDDDVLCFTAHNDVGVFESFVGTEGGMYTADDDGDVRHCLFDLVGEFITASCGGGHNADAYNVGGFEVFPDFGV